MIHLLFCDCLFGFLLVIFSLFLFIVFWFMLFVYLPLSISAGDYVFVSCFAVGCFCYLGCFCVSSFSAFIACGLVSLFYFVHFCFLLFCRYLIWSLCCFLRFFRCYLFCFWCRRICKLCNDLAVLCKCILQLY